jgi:predicted HTH domain antitoxin
MRVAVAIKWYELGEISQGKASEIAGLSRSKFISALSRYQVDFIQYSEADGRFRKC